DGAACHADADGAPARPCGRVPAAEGGGRTRHQGNLQGNTKQIVGDGKVEGVELDDGRIVPATLVVMAVGIRPSIGLARDAGLAVNRGIVVDHGMHTSDGDILALGECAEVDGMVYGLVAPLYEMARIAASHLAGDTTPAFVHSDTPTKLKVTGIDLYSLG